MTTTTKKSKKKGGKEGKGPTQGVAGGREGRKEAGTQASIE